MEVIYTDDLVVVAETEDHVIKSLNEWKVLWRIEA